jgi:hypothetical protein
MLNLDFSTFILVLQEAYALNKISVNLLENSRNKCPLGHTTKCARNS